MQNRKQILPDTYSVPVKITIQKPATNARYKHFHQTHFTAGDEEQFIHEVSLKPIHKVEKISEDLVSTYWNGYLMSAETMIQTFRYLFYKFKKGLCIQIRDGQLITFLPFSNVHFVNEWSDRLQIPDGFFHKNNALSPHQWYSNNGLFRYESPCNETDTGMCHMKHMFETLCRVHGKSIPDVDLFINRRDFPLLRKSKCEAYHNLFDSKEIPLLSHSYCNYTPILSSCGSDEFADICIPTMDDWTQIMLRENVHFASTNRKIACSNDQFLGCTWSRKKPVAVFRGSSTGLGTTIENNIRLRLVHMFADHPHCDVALTAWNPRFRKVMGDPRVQEQIPDPSIAMGKSLTFEEQSHFKFIIHAPGHVQAYRLSLELAMRSVILLIDSEYQLWYQKWLNPWEHYVPVSADLSDLNERIKWCLTHDEECKIIASQAREFYDRVLTKESCLKYLKDICISLSVAHTRVPYGTLNFHGLQTRFVHHFLSNSSVSFVAPQKKSNLQHGKKRMTISCLKKNWVQYLRPKVFSSHSYERRNVFQSAHTKIELMLLSPENKIILKKLSNQSMYSTKYKHRYIHEHFVGLLCVNQILRSIPNFAYTYPVSLDADRPILYLEYIQGETMFDFIRGNSFSLNKWMFLMIQSILAILVAQRECFFRHNDMCSWNILISEYPEEHIFDYLVLDEKNVAHVVRIYTTCIPIIIDYDKVDVIYDLQFIPAGILEYAREYPQFPKYHDVLCLFLNSVFNILKFQQSRLTPSEKDLLLYLFRECVTDPVYCPRESIKNLEDVSKFLHDAHKFANLSFSHKGELLYRSPFQMFELFQKWYKVSHFGNRNILNTVEKQPPFYCYRNVVFTENVFLFSEQECGLLRIYANQLMRNEEDISFPEGENWTVNLPRVPTESHVTDVPKKYQNILNILLEIAMGFSDKPSQDRFLALIQNNLKTISDIYAYSKYLVKFKLQRNIL